MKLITGDAAALYGAQCVDLVVPLVVVLALANTLGPANFAGIAFWQSMVGAGSILVGFGITPMAVRELSLAENRKYHLSSTFLQIIAARSLIAIVLIASWWVVSSFGWMSGDFRNIATFAMLALLAAAANPLWVYQGIQKQTVYAGLTVVLRVAMMVLVLMTVRRKEDVLLAALLVFGTPLLQAGLLVLTLFLRYELRPVCPDCREVLNVIRQNWRMAAQQVAVAAWNASNMLAIAFFMPVGIVANYALADKAIVLSKALITPLSQALFPRAAMAIKQDPANYGSAIRPILIGGIVLTSAFALSAWLFIGHYDGRVMEEYSEARTLIALATIVAIPHVVSNVLGTQCLLASGHADTFAKLTILVAIVHLFMLPILIKFIGASGAVLTTILSESAFALLAAWLVKRLRIL